MFRNILRVLDLPYRPAAPNPLYTAAHLIRSRTDVRDRLRLHRLLYLAQVLHLGRTGTPLFPDDVIAGSLGPVIPNLELLLRHHPRKIPSLDLHIAALPTSNLRAVFDVVDRIGELSTFTLHCFTHQTTSAWYNCYDPEQASPRAPFKGVIIPLDAMLEEFQLRRNSLPNVEREAFHLMTPKDEFGIQHA